MRDFVPCLTWELDLWQSGTHIVAGLDEVGRGPLAGPLVAAAVVLPPDFSAAWLAKVRDSKILTAAQRESLAVPIRRDALGVGVGFASTREVDCLGVVRATRTAMRRALARLPEQPEHLLIDALVLPRLRTPQTALIHGDGRCISIACASIIAKVARDRWMLRLDARYPGYGFAEHKGYGTAAHCAALARLGPSPIHRRSFAPVRTALQQKELADGGRA